MTMRVIFSFLAIVYLDYGILCTSSTIYCSNELFDYAPTAITSEQYSALDSPPPDSSEDDDGDGLYGPRIFT